MHIKEGKTVCCPFRQFEKQFDVLSSFTSHVTRKQRNRSKDDLVDAVVGSSVLKKSTSHESNERETESNLDLNASNFVDVDQSEISMYICRKCGCRPFVENLALFYLKLQAKLLLPPSVIQAILEDFQEIHNISQSHLAFKLKEKMIQLKVPEAAINIIIGVMKTENLLRTFNSGTLKMDQRKKLCSQIASIILNQYKYSWDR